MIAVLRYFGTGFLGERSHGGVAGRVAIVEAERGIMSQRDEGVRVGGFDFFGAGELPAPRLPAAEKAGFVIFTTPTGSPSAPPPAPETRRRARKFWSCWLPSGASSTSSPQ